MSVQTIDTAKILLALLDALERKDTLRDGAWGYKNFSGEVRDLKNALAALIESNAKNG